MPRVAQGFNNLASRAFSRASDNLLGNVNLTFQQFSTLRLALLSTYHSLDRETCWGERMINDLNALFDGIGRGLGAHAWVFKGLLPTSNSDEAFLAALVALFLFCLVVAASDPVRSLMFRRYKSKQWDLCTTSKNDTGGDKDSWNIVEMRREDIEGFNGVTLDKNKIYNTVVVEVRDGWRVRSHMARLKINQQHAKGKVSVHQTLADKLGLHGLQDADATKEDSCSANLDFNVRHPAWYLLVPFWKHPDPNTRLQWQMSFLFLFLGIALPKFIDSLLS